VLTWNDLDGELCICKHHVLEPNPLSRPTKTENYLFEENSNLFEKYLEIKSNFIGVKNTYLVDHKSKIDKSGCHKTVFNKVRGHANNT